MHCSLLTWITFFFLGYLPACSTGRNSAVFRFFWIWKLQYPKKCYKFFRRHLPDLRTVGTRSLRNVTDFSSGMLQVVFKVLQLIYTLLFQIKKLCQCVASKTSFKYQTWSMLENPRKWTQPERKQKVSTFSFILDPCSQSLLRELKKSDL